MSSKPSGGALREARVPVRVGGMVDGGGGRRGLGLEGGGWGGVSQRASRRGAGVVIVNSFRIVVLLCRREADPQKLSDPTSVIRAIRQDRTSRTATHLTRTSTQLSKLRKPATMVIKPTYLAQRTRSCTSLLLSRGEGG